LIMARPYANVLPSSLTVSSVSMLDMPIRLDSFPEMAQPASLASERAPPSVNAQHGVGATAVPFVSVIDGSLRLDTCVLVRYFRARALSWAPLAMCPESTLQWRMPRERVSASVTSAGAAQMPQEKDWYKSVAQSILLRVKAPLEITLSDTWLHLLSRKYLRSCYSYRCLFNVTELCVRCLLAGSLSSFSTPPPLSYPAMPRFHVQLVYQL
jgi:hypothetical protein